MQIHLILVLHILHESDLLYQIEYNFLSIFIMKAI